MSHKDLSNILHISTRQLNRYDKDGLLPAELSSSIYEFSRIYARGTEGIRLVNDLLSQIEFGFYS